MEMPLHPPLLSRAEVIDLLLQHDVTPTQQRVAIAMALLSRDQHVSAETVLAQVNQAAPQVSKATVYNTLGLLVSKGLVRELMIDPQKVVYDSNTQPHHHFYNVDTGALLDVAPGTLMLTEFPPLPAGTYAEGIEVIVRIRNQA